MELKQKKEKLQQKNKENKQKKEELERKKEERKQKQLAKANKKCKCESDKRNWQEFPHLKEVLPENYQYKVCEFALQINGFVSLLRVGIHVPDEMKAWKKSFEEKTKTTYRVHRTSPRVGKKVLFKEWYCCQHSTKNKRLPKGKSKKNTECQSSLILTVKKFSSSPRNGDPHLKTMPALIQISWQHNHTLHDVLKHRDVAESTKEELRSLFAQGHKAGSALETYKANIHAELGDDGFSYAAGDRKIMPDYKFVWRLWYSYKNKKPEALKNEKRDLEEEDNGGFADFVDLDDIEITTEDRVALAWDEYQTVTKQFNNSLLNRIKENPDEFLPAIKSFTKIFEQLNSDRRIVDALSSFGKQCPPKPKMIKMKPAPKRLKPFGKRKSIHKTLVKLTQLQEEKL